MNFYRHIPQVIILDQYINFYHARHFPHALPLSVLISHSRFYQHRLHLSKIANEFIISHNKKIQGCIVPKLFN